jgi:two-component SAPR family response regulator
MLFYSRIINFTAYAKSTYDGSARESLTNNSGEEGLALLARYEVDVIIMSQMTGVDFLRKVKILYPNNLRIVFRLYRI